MQSEPTKTPNGRVVGSTPVEGQKYRIATFSRSNSRVEFNEMDLCSEDGSNKT